MKDENISYFNFYLIVKKLALVRKLFVFKKKVKTLKHFKLYKS